MPWFGLEPTISASERAETVHALDRSATVTGDFADKKTNKLRGMSPQANYTDRVTAACRRS
jgi:hypothetical protein